LAELEVQKYLPSFPYRHLVMACFNQKTSAKLSGNEMKKLSLVPDNIGESKFVWNVNFLFLLLEEMWILQPESRHTSSLYGKLGRYFWTKVLPNEHKDQLIKFPIKFFNLMERIDWKKIKFPYCPLKLNKQMEN